MKPHDCPDFLQELAPGCQECWAKNPAFLTALRAMIREELALALRAPAPPDATVDLLHAAHEAIGNKVFSAAELLSRGLHPDATALAMLLQEKSVRSVGRLLAASADRATLDGLTLRRVGTDRSGAIWVFETRCNKHPVGQPREPTTRCES